MSSQGIFAVAVILVFELLFALFLFYIRKKIESTIKTEHEKFLIEYQKKLDIFFRNEPVRANVLTDTIKIANEKRIEIYKKLNDIMFKIPIKNSNENYKKEDEKNIQDFRSRLKDIEIEISSNSMHLGELTDCFNLVRVYLSDWLIFIQSPEDFKCYSDRFENACKQMNFIKEWISKNMKTHYTLEQVDLSEEGIRSVAKERMEFLKSTSNIGEKANV